MEFNISDFVNNLRNEMYIHFPWEYNHYINEIKHPNRTGNIRVVAFMNNDIVYLNENQQSFDIGNVYAEERHPYYHILQDAPVIRKRNKATKETKGSQAKVKYLGQRDYGRVSFNGKTYTKEYVKNVRGSRKSIIEHATQWKVDEATGYLYKANRQSNSYVNVHYHYIDKQLDLSIPIVASQFGGKVMRKQLTSLEDEFLMQEQEDEMIRNMINSFM